VPANRETHDLGRQDDEATRVLDASSGGDDPIAVANHEYAEMQKLLKL